MSRCFVLSESSIPADQNELVSRNIQANICTFLDIHPACRTYFIDEAFLDVTGSLRLFGPAETIAATIREHVRERLGLTVSVGIVFSKLVAKIASDYFDKPDGLTVIPTGQKQSFLASLSITRLWGVGKATSEALALLGVQTNGDLSRLSRISYNENLASTATAATVPP